MGYFSFERKLWATEDIAFCYECAKKVGIDEHLFVNFGLLLGIVREKDFIAHDNDIDMSIHADRITKEQQLEYINYLGGNVDENGHLKRPLKTLKELAGQGMFFGRDRGSKRKDTGMYTWFSLRKRPGRSKFCHWCGFEWQGFWWWSKAGKWVTPRKFDYERWGYDNNTQGIMLGMPAEYVRELIWIKFRGIKVQIPKHFGSALDWMYPGWVVPKKGGSSKKQIVCIVPRWDDPRTWKVKMG
jgi:hypothetical protein